MSIKTIRPTKVTLNSDPAELRAALKAVGVKTEAKTKEAILGKFATTPFLTTPNTRVPVIYKMKYGASADCGDEIAALLKEVDLFKVADENNINISRWAGKNNGMLRMNLGNVLRGRVRRGEHVVINGKTFN